MEVRGGGFLARQRERFHAEKRLPAAKNKIVGPTFHFGKSIMGNYWRLTFFPLP